MIYLVLGLLAAVLAILVATDGSSSIAGIVEPDQFAGLTWAVAILALILAGSWRQLRDRPGQNLRALLIWILVGGAAFAAYVYRDHAGEIGGRLVGALRPGRAVTGPGGEVTITRRADGDFVVEAQVNGRPERFTFDTGASAVVLTAESAEALGIRVAAEDYNVRVSTANGVALAAPILLDSVAVGPIAERRVPAVVSRPGALTTNLLGMSFLSRLPSYEVRGDRLILRGR